jgi:hypothetical protein
VGERLGHPRAPCTVQGQIRTAGLTIGVPAAGRVARQLVEALDVRDQAGRLREDASLPVSAAGCRRPNTCRRPPPGTSLGPAPRRCYCIVACTRHGRWSSS